MTIHPPLGAIALLAALLACASSAPPKSSPSAQPITVGNVVVTPIAPGVYAAIRKEPLSLAVNANSLFIVNDEDVVVVDAQFTRAATLENIAALRQITNKPVRVVINTHWHDDHLAGNQVYRDAYPGVRFISQRNTRDDLATKGRQNRTDQVKFAPGAAARFQRLLDMGLGGDSTPVSPMERVALTSAVGIIRQYLAESNGFQEVLADTVVDRHLTLVRGERTIELLWFGRGNTRGDLVTYLPADGVVSTGDLLVAPIPFAFGSYPTEWIAVLDSIEALSPKVIVPGHGPIMRDLAYLHGVRRMLSTVTERARSEVAKGASVEDALKNVTLADLRGEVAGDEKWMRVMFGMFFRVPVVSRAYEEAKRDTLP